MTTLEKLQQVLEKLGYGHLSIQESNNNLSKYFVLDLDLEVLNLVMIDALEFELNKIPGEFVRLRLLRACQEIEHHIQERIKELTNAPQ